jgi:hypothetical protein
MNNQFQNYGTGYGLVRPRTSVFIMPIDTAPIKIEPEPPRQFEARMLKQYREKSYPLGKTKRGFKKWLKRKLTNIACCKTFKQALRKYKV